MTLFTRDDLVGALRDLIEELHGAGDTVGLRLVGGGALALRYFDRRTTNDLDALHVRPGSDEAVVKAARLVAERRGWDPTWINFEVTGSGGEPLYGRGCRRRRPTPFPLTRSGIVPRPARHAPVPLPPRPRSARKLVRRR